MKTAKQHLQFGIDTRIKYFSYTSVNVNWNNDNTECLVRIALSSNTYRMILGKIENNNTVTFKEHISIY